MGYIKAVYKLDEKNRFSLPKKFLSPRKFFITLGLDGCISLYPRDVWDEIQKKISPLNYGKENNRKFLRLFYAYSNELVPDSHNRLTIPEYLRKEAGIKNKILIIKIGNWYEIWNPEKFKKFEKENKKSFSTFAGKLNIL